MIKIIEDDLLCAKEDILGHQVNAKGKMGSGVAKALRNKYPNIFAPYEKACDMYKSRIDELMGKCQFVRCSDEKIIANLFGQAAYGYDGAQYTSIPALRNSLEYLKSEAQKRGMSIALPYKIGSDRGGADWNEVYTMIDEIFADYEVTLYWKK